MRFVIAEHILGKAEVKGSIPFGSNSISVRDQ